jgi:hypothetical protein
VTTVASLANFGTLVNSGRLLNEGTLDNYTGGTLENNAGRILENRGTLANYTGGILNNNAGGALYNTGALNNNGGTLTNSGEIGGGGTYKQVSGQTVNTGIMGQRTIEIWSGSFVANGLVTVSDKFRNGGYLSGGGTIQGVLENSGTVNPGSSPGILRITGNYNQFTTGRLIIELGSLVDYDKLFITGKATLAGWLDVDLYGGFTPQDGDEFTFLTAGLIAGTFQFYDLPFGEDDWQITYGADFVKLTYHGGVDPAAVPEPGTMLLLGFGLIGIAAARKKFRK